MNKRGTILVENIIFIVLNLIFLTILTLFLFRQGNGAVVLEQSYAKEIASMIDSSKPVMTMRLNMQEGFEVAKKNGIAKEDIVKREGNVITVKLTNKGGYSYSFFNDVDVSIFPDDVSDLNYIIKINNYNKHE